MPDPLSIGSFLLLLALAAAAVSAVGAWRWDRGREASRRWAVRGTLLAAGFLTAAFALLLRAFLADDFRHAVVVGYSSIDLPLLYKVSAVWAGQEGSLLLWTMFAALIGLAILRLRPEPDPLALSIFQGTQVALIGILFFQAPFRAAQPVPPDGQGLNPLLQDPWMATHPPVVFLGYAAATLPFALALAAAWRGERRSWVQVSLRWTHVTVLTLGSGILLGAFWAYEVLGWGGFWGWDPVENSSLIPWLTAIALVHGLLVQRQTGALVRTNLLLALFTYILVLYATFLTRSGVLSSVSVHSFPQGGIFAPLLTLLILLTVVSAVAVLRRSGALAGEPLAWRLDLGSILTLGLGLIVVSAGVILGGTSWPILSAMFGEPAAPKPGFYNTANLPLYVAIASVLVAAPLLAWKAIPFRRLLRVSVVPVITGFAAAAWSLWLGIDRPLYLALMLFSGAAVGSCIVRTVRVVRVPMKVGAPLAHVGLALLLAGVLISSVGERRQDLQIPLGESRTVLGQELEFEGVAPGGDGDARFRVRVDPARRAVPADVALVDTDGGQIQRKPAIVRRLAGDLYLSPVGVERRPRLSRSLALRQGETVPYEDQLLRFEGFAMGEHTDAMQVGARIRTSAGWVEPAIRQTSQGTVAEPVPIPGTDARVALRGMNVETRTVFLEVLPAGAPSMLHLEVSWKPGMNLVWGGALVACLGTGIALARRAGQERTARAGQEAPEGARAARARRKRNRPPVAA